MFERLFPSQLDNRYRGHRLALWLLYPIVLLNLAISLGGIFAPDGGAQSADGIPLSAYPAAAAQAVIGVAAFLGLANLWINLICVLALARYRAMVPMIYLMLTADFVLHKGVGMLKPIARDGTTTGLWIDGILFGACALGLALSLSGRRYGAPDAPGLRQSATNR